MKKTFLTVLFLILFCVPVSAAEIPAIDGYGDFSLWVEKFSLGDAGITAQGVLSNLLAALTREIKSFSMVATGILVMTLLSSSVGTLNDAVGQRASSYAAFFAFFTAISSMALGCFMQALGYAQEVVVTMTDFMAKLTPVLIITLFACSKSASAIAFEPVLSAAVVVVSEIIKYCMVPLITYSAVLSVAGNLGEKNRISGFVKIVKSLTKWIMTLIITVFTGINTVYGFSSPALDAVATKTAKFAVGSLVPVVGGFLSETFDTVTTSAAVMKNAVGVSGIIMISIITVTPVIKIGIMQIILKLISAVTEPIADKRISGMLWEMGEALTALFGVVVLTAVLFVINICIILRATA